MSLLRWFYTSLYCTSNNLKNLQFNDSFKIGVHFKAQSLKKPWMQFFKFFISCILFLYFQDQLQRTQKHICNISKTKNVKIVAVFLLLFVLIY